MATTFLQALLFCLLLFCSACGQSNTGRTLPVNDTLTAVGIAETVLFETYGKDNILSQKPYDIQYVNNCWVIGGTMPKNEKGGTFLIVIDSHDGKVMSLTHGK